MTVAARCARVLSLLERVRIYDVIVRNDSFSDEALREMKQNCREILLEADGELKEIWKEVQGW